ncbi:MAG: hypothetical protein HOD92_17625 [Deltaproteobacteria bacterium]|jgi:hypothetical protein|nr:hypothetical protein [Deltaproteobacteria bacterium]
MEPFIETVYEPMEDGWYQTEDFHEIFSFNSVFGTHMSPNYLFCIQTLINQQGKVSVGGIQFYCIPNSILTTNGERI